MNSWEVYQLVLVQGDILDKKWCTPTTSHNEAVEFINLPEKSDKICEFLELFHCFLSKIE